MLREDRNPVHTMLAEWACRALFQIKQGCPFQLPVLLCISVIMDGAAEHRFNSRKAGLFSA